MTRKPQSLTAHLRHRVYRAAWIINDGATALHCGRILTLTREHTGKFGNSSFRTRWHRRIGDNAARGVKMPERSLKRPHQFLSADEAKHLIVACDEPTRTIVLLATMTGLRIGEILALGWARIDFMEETLTVAETCYKGRFGTPKTKASRREVPLSPAVVEALKVRYAQSTNHSLDGLVFANRNGGALVANNLRKRGLHSACIRAGLPRVNWHALRHTHGTLLHVQGTPLKVAQAQLGHSHMATTLEVYIHSSVNEQREAVNLLDGQLLPIVPKKENGTESSGEPAVSTN
jgi:integrase